jgi:hypothetical protein
MCVYVCACVCVHSLTSLILLAIADDLTTRKSRTNYKTFIMSDAVFEVLLCLTPLVLAIQLMLTRMARSSFG